MAIRPEIPLSVQPFQSRSPLESFQRAVSIRDMISNMQQGPARKRAQQLQTRTAELDLETKELQAAQARKTADMLRTKDEVLKANTTWDDAKGFQINIPSAVKTLGPQYPELALTLQQQQKAIEKEALDASIAKWNQESQQYKQFGDLFAGEDDAVNEQEYNRIPPQIKQSLNLPPAYSPEAVQYLKSTAERRRTDAERKVTAELKKIEAESGQAKKVDEFTNAAGERVLAMQQPDGSIKYEKSTEKVKPDEPSDRQRETELIEEAYGQIKLKGKTRDKMTAAEKVASVRWNEAASTDPAKKTDLNKMMELFRSPKPEDRALFNALKGNFDEGPTPSNKISILNTLMNSSVKFPNGPMIPELYDKNRKLYLPIWPDIPSYEEAQKITPKQAAAKPTGPMAGKTATKAAITDAAKKAGVPAADAEKQFTDAGGTIVP